MPHPKHIVCFSGGEGSALVAIEVFRKYGSENLILLNHDIHESVEDADIKRFKREVATYCESKVAYANMAGWDSKDQFDVVVEAKAFKVGNGTALCTNRLKTAPFERWLKINSTPGEDTLYYGFSAGETKRILRRSSHLAVLGYKTAFPLAHWTRTIQSTTEIGIDPPLTYGVFKHANCQGCLKAGMQHWYVVYCTRPDIWEKGIWAEDEIGYSIIKGHPLAGLELKFEIMKSLGIEASEKIPAATFWASAKRIIGKYEESELQTTLPCECST